ncbi:archaeosortase A (PGF-CTERM-specific) [Methanomicrobium sp. W14]|uniref:archaeosortase A n=1 Tax=Methanomicrobium sp. W14 TaxID=2817839 RepID=UPI001AEAA5FB|nr:archaeosortase A [Methanomicrobium sp. W14]MBP2132125.1 archaeosortase A (PGF-CTERM-specific) [Methanomicrobium sp. W14]
MEAILVFLSAVAFIAFLVCPGSKRNYFAAFGWIAIVLSIIIDIPYYIYEENNFMYPVLGILGLPFLYVTVPQLLEGNKYVNYLSRGAAIAFLIYLPFAYIPGAGDCLIAVVTSQVYAVGSFLGLPFSRIAWNMLGYNGFSVEIILACTGIQSIAIMLGLAYCVPTTFRQKVLSFLIIAPVIYILNIFRNVFVVAAYTGQWFQFLPEIASNGELGYESFFWAHNVMAELGALVFLIILALGLFMVIPGLGDFADGLIKLYTKKLKGVCKGK